MTWSTLPEITPRQVMIPPPFWDMRAYRASRDAARSFGSSGMPLLAEFSLMSAGPFPEHITLCVPAVVSQENAEIVTWSVTLKYYIRHVVHTDDYSNTL